MINKRSSRKFLLLSVVLLGLCCLLTVAAGIGYFFFWPKTVEARPVVLFVSPSHREEVAVERPLTIHTVANDESKIKRVELWIDGRLHQAQDSTLPGGTSPFPLVVYWQPPSPGTHTLTARAFNTQGGRAHVSIDVEVIAAVAQSDEADSDGDGLSDSEDVCPNQSGLFEYDGCPLPNDGDGDGIPDDVDECPDAPGTLVTEGCPDADGDSIPDFGDDCPDEPGGPGAPRGDGCPAPGDTDRDGDGIPDDEDACPDVGGSPETEGCPDADGDGVRDGEDECPDEPGLPGDGGCPVTGGGEDSDGDGVRDFDDECPDEPGLPDLDGCPERDGDGAGDDSGDSDSTDDGDSADEDSGDDAGDDDDDDVGDGDGDDAGDGDGDGVLDDVDLCPDEAGLPEHEGCPAPGEEGDDDSDGIPDDEGGPSDEDSPTFPDMDLASAMIAVEFQALAFEVSHDYDGMYCYPRLTGLSTERFSFEPLGERQWDIAADLGSRTLALLPIEDLEVSIECGGDNVFPGDEGSWGVYFDLGSATRSHPASDWDGHVITVRSTGGDTGRWFEAQYRICEGSCDDSAFQPPIISLFHYGGDSQLILMWGGDRGAIDGFWVYADNSRAFRLPADTTSQSIAGYEPLCGDGRREFYVTAYQGGRESPPSNLAFWSRRPCPRVVRVTFEQIETFAMEDERRMDGQLGPVFGSFWAQGSEEETLSFEGSDYPNGIKFSSNSTYNIQSIFDQIWVWVVNNTSPWYRAPDHNTVTVALGPDDDLTFGGVIYDQDWQVYQRVFLGSHTIPASEVAPGRYTIRDGQFELTVLIDVLVGPEAGEKPDLTITDVTEIEGQLRIHVFNNAAPLENRDVEVNLVRISTNEIIETRTWENVTIPSGGQRYFQSAELMMEPYDLRVILDPNNNIDEMEEGNNIFETPVVMRVEFTGLQVPSWPCEGWLHQNAEVWFLLSVGYGPSPDEVSWVGHRVRYPESGIIQWNRHDRPRPTWSLDGQERYTFEFEMPADENLYVWMRGYEQDGSSNDSMGYIEADYRPPANYGARSDAYHARSIGPGTTECDAWEPVGPEYFGFEAWWRITRVH